MLKVIMAITFIGKYKYTIGFTYLPLKDRKEGNVSLGQPRIHVTVKAACLFLTLCLLPKLEILKKLKQKMLYHFFFLPTSFPQFCFNHLVLKHYVQHIFNIFLNFGTAAVRSHFFSRWILVVNKPCEETWAGTNMFNLFT